MNPKGHYQILLEQWQLLDKFGKKRWDCDVKSPICWSMLVLYPWWSLMEPLWRFHSMFVVTKCAWCAGSTMQSCCWWFQYGSMPTMTTTARFCLPCQPTKWCVKLWKLKEVPHMMVCTTVLTQLFAGSCQLAREWEADMVKGFHRDRSRYKKSKPWQKKRKWKIWGEADEAQRLIGH